MKPMIRALSCILLAAVLSAAPALACTFTFTEIVPDVTTSTVGSDCWWGGPSDNRMIIYNQISTLTVFEEYEVTVNYCNFTQTRELIGITGSTTNVCWEPTSTGCVGKKDWMPSPICS